MINTLKYTKRLEAAGFSRIQAEAQALAIQDAFDGSIHQLATKGDLRIVATQLEAKIDRVEITLGSGIRELKSDVRMIKWVLGLMVPLLITLAIPAIQSIYLQLNAS